jgi:phage-related minor tail protein
MATSGEDVTRAVVAFAPVVKALVLAAEETGATGQQKKAAVAQAAEHLYAGLQSSIKELRGVPWDVVGPLVTAASVGLIDVLVGLLNTLWGKVWRWIGGDE